MTQQDNNFDCIKQYSAFYSLANDIVGSCRPSANYDSKVSHAEDSSVEYRLNYNGNSVVLIQNNEQVIVRSEHNYTDVGTITHTITAWPNNIECKQVSNLNDMEQVLAHHILRKVDKDEYVLTIFNSNGTSNNVELPNQKDPNQILKFYSFAYGQSIENIGKTLHEITHDDVM